MEKSSFWKQKETKLLIANSLTWVFFLIFLVLAIYIYNHANPYPERYFIKHMDKEMLKQGQHISLIFIYGSIALAFTSFLVNFIISLLTINAIFISKNVYVRQKNGPYFEDKQQEEESKAKGFWYYFLLFIFYFIYFFFGFILILYLWLIHIKENTKFFKSSVFILNQKEGKFQKKSKIIFFLLVILWPILLFMPFLVASSFSKRDFKNKWIPDLHVTQYLTLPNNKPNVIQLYFDRSCGILWNILLIIDDKLNQESNSFIKMFPEFTSYINTVSISSLTKVSNPTIYAGPLFHPYLKEHSAHNFFNSEINSNLTLDDWYFNSLKSEIKMFQNNGISHISLNNLPYYRDTKMDNWFGNMKALQDDIDKSGIKNVITMTNPKLAEKMDNYDIAAKDETPELDYHVLDVLPNYLNFKKTYFGGKLTTFFSQQTHEPYTYIKNGELITDTSRNGIVFSMWQMMQQLKHLFTRLKNEPFYDDHGNVSGTVYDHSLISIISDHGVTLHNVSLFKDLLDWLSSNNLINSYSKNLLLNFNYFGFNPVICIKSFNENKPDFTFNTDQIVALSDLVRIYEIELNKYNNQKNKAPYFLTKQNINKIKNKVLEDFVRGQFLLNPLDPSVNSISNKVIKNRLFYIANTDNWKYKGYKKTFELVKIAKFQFDTTRESIFHNGHFKKW